MADKRKNETKINKRSYVTKADILKEIRGYRRDTEIYIFIIMMTIGIILSTMVISTMFYTPNWSNKIYIIALPFALLFTLGSFVYGIFGIIKESKEGKK